jgi:hypothetical protein
VSARNRPTLAATGAVRSAPYNKACLAEPRGDADDVARQVQHGVPTTSAGAGRRRPMSGGTAWYPALASAESPPGVPKLRKPIPQQNPRPCALWRANSRVCQVRQRVICGDEDANPPSLVRLRKQKDQRPRNADVCRHRTCF